MNKYIDRFVNDVARGVSLALRAAIVLIGFLAIMWFVGSLVDTAAYIKERDAREARCTQPLEYHRCMSDTGDKQGCGHYLRPHQC